MVNIHKHVCPSHGLETCRCYDGVGRGDHFCKIMRQKGVEVAFQGRRIHKSELHTEIREQTKR